MRKDNVFKNFVAGISGKLLSPLLSFIERTVFISLLSEEYLGINGLFGSVLTVLSLTELGFDAAIAYAMYKPAAENDVEKLKSLMAFYRRIFRIVGAVFLGLGTLLVPVIPYLAKGSTELVNLRLIFFLNILSSTASYWFFAYKGQILSAYQKGYKVTAISLTFSAATTAVRIAALYLFRNTPTLDFYIYTILGIVMTIAKNLAVSRKVDKLYPYMLDKNVVPLTKEEKQPIYRNVLGTATNKICWKLNDGIDNTVISALVGVVNSGVYSNYLVIKNIVTTLANTIFGSLHTSLGNFCATESRERKEEFFHTLQFLYFWIFGWFSICLWMLFDPFIQDIWLHDAKWLLAPLDRTLLCFNFLIEGLAGAIVKYRDVHGMYYETRYRYVLSTVLNISLSIVLTGPVGMGVTGALIGTTASLFAVILFDPGMVYKRVFHKSAAEYYRTYFAELALVLVTAATVYLICRAVPGHSFGTFVLKCVVCTIVPNGFWYVLFRKRPEAQYLWKSAWYVLNKYFKLSQILPKK